MTNMFSGNADKKIPNDLRDCCKTDDVTNNLWDWCERVESWGFRICIFLAIIGTISIISNGIQASQLLKELNIDMNEIKTAAAEYGIEIKSVFEVVVEGIFDWFLYCFIEYCTYHIIALLIASLASIVQHTRITANVALYTAANPPKNVYVQPESNSNNKAENKKEKESQPSKTNKPKQDDNSQKSSTYTVKDANTIICSECGFEQPSGRTVCFKCAASFTDPNKDKTDKKETHPSYNDPNIWICPECKKSNKSDVCWNCGMKFIDKDNPEQLKGPLTPVNQAECWTCKNCKTKNNKHDSFCKNCGTYK